MSKATPDGFYLTTYFAPPALTPLLEFSPRHDNNMSLWQLRGRRVELIRHWELERLSGLKQHSAGFASATQARLFIERALADEGVAIDEVHECWGTPGLDWGGPYGSPTPALPLHAVAHLYTAAYLDSDVFHRQRILCFAPDGGPDHVLGRTTNWYAGAYVDRGSLTFFPIESPGRIYDSASKAFGLRAGTLMALAGVPDLELPSMDANDLVADLEFWGDGPTGLLDGAVRSGELAVARAQDAVARLLGSDPPNSNGLSSREVYVGAVMSLLQRACETVMKRNVDRFLSETGLDPMTMHLGMSGGYALNCPNNSRLMSGFGFRTLIAPPCPNDSGQAIGVGLAVLHSRIPELEFKLSSAYLGRPAIHAPRLMPGAAHTPPSSSEFDTAQFVADVESGPVGWVSGCSEIGPRALGHRSILADPRNQASKTQLNAVKGRQWWRPVAPLVLQGHVGDWFTGARASKYMLETFDIIPSKRPLVPAVVHLDGSARVQTLLQVDDPLLYRALDAFAASTAVPILCNTSLNDRGEPITQTAQQAIEFCAAKGIHICYVDGERVEVHQSLDYRSMERELHVRVLCAAELAVLTERLNPHGLSSEEIYFFITTPQLCQLNPSRQADANVIRTAAKDYYDTHPSDLEWVSRRAASAHQSASVLVAES